MELTCLVVYTKVFEICEIPSKNPREIQFVNLLLAAQNLDKIQQKYIIDLTWSKLVDNLPCRPDIEVKLQCLSGYGVVDQA